MARRTRKADKRNAAVSETDRLAKRAAAAIAKGQSPKRSHELEDYFNGSPREIFAALDGAVTNMPPSGTHDALASGYLFLLEGLLLHLRYGIDRGYVDAVNLVSEFQAAVAARVRDRSITAPMLGPIVGTLQKAGIAAASELVEASAMLAEQGTGPVVEADLSATMTELVEACGGDAFALVASAVQACHAMPEAARVAMVSGLACADHPVARSSAVLFLLDPSPETRMAAVAGLAQVCSALSPVDLRRLRTIREWRPERERSAIDALVRRAEEAGIEAAPWPAANAEEILASGIDGATSQGMVVLSASGRKRRISSILVKSGIADAFVGDEMSLRQADSTLTRVETEGEMSPVSQSYLDSVVCHHLAMLTAQGSVPPLGLLDVAETMGSAGWRPIKLEFDTELSRLLASVPKSMLRPASVNDILGGSALLAQLIPGTDSWFEDDAEIRRIHAASRGAVRDKRIEYLLRTSFHQRRGKWAELFLRTALWLREVDDGSPCWRELAIIARAVAEGRDLAQVGLMLWIAIRTVDYLEASGRGRF